MEDKLIALCEKITKEGRERLVKRGLDCPENLDNARAHYHIAQKYTRVDVGTSGRYMVENITGEIFGIKAYGVIHRGHNYGNLDTINDYYWGDFKAYPINILEKIVGITKKGE